MSDFIEVPPQLARILQAIDEADIHSDLPVDLAALGVDLRRAFEGIIFSDVDIRNWTLAGLSFRDAEFRRVKMTTDQEEYLRSAQVILTASIIDQSVGEKVESSAKKVVRVHQLEKISRGDPNNSSFVFDQCVVFDQAPWGGSYRPGEIELGVSQEDFKLQREHTSLIEKYAPSQIGDNLPHFYIRNFRRSTRDYGGVNLELGRSWYRDVRAVQAALLADPDQAVNSDGETLINFLTATSPIDFLTSRVPSQLSVNGIIILSKNEVAPELLICQRGPANQVGYFPSAWSVSFQETMSAPYQDESGVRIEGDRNLFECAVRGLEEEFLGERPLGVDVEFLGFFIEGTILNQSSIASAKVAVDFIELCERRRFLADDAPENGFLAAVPFRADVLLRLLQMEHKIDLDFVMEVGRADPGGASFPAIDGSEWHPSARLAVWMCLRRYFPAEAKEWMKIVLGRRK